MNFYAHYLSELQITRGVVRCCGLSVRLCLDRWFPCWCLWLASGWGSWWLIRGNGIVHVTPVLKMFVSGDVKRLVVSAHCAWDIVIRRQFWHRLKGDYMYVGLGWCRYNWSAALYTSHVSLTLCVTLSESLLHYFASGWGATKQIKSQCTEMNSKTTQRFSTSVKL